ncbi:MAG: hypothetical protein LWX11_11495 [Firmicutes bacterium]|nr:hypothetical protein [Bacillota bacterium]
MKRLGLARHPHESLGRAVQRAHWEPVFWAVTEMRPTHQPMPVINPLAAIVLSPAGARMAQLPEDLLCFATGEATAKALGPRPVILSSEPRAEGLWERLQAHFPQGGDFLLIRGERSRGHLEAVAQGTAWRLHPWITHQEAPLNPTPPRPAMDAVLALSPLQAEVLAPLCGDVRRFAWGERAGGAFERMGAPAHGVCESTVEALERMLEESIHS